MVRKIFLWIGLSYSFMCNAQLVLKSGVTSSSTTNSNSIYTNGKFKIGGLTNGTAPTTDPTASLEVNGDVKVNMTGDQPFSVTSTKQIPNIGTVGANLNTSPDLITLSGNGITSPWNVSLSSSKFSFRPYNSIGCDIGTATYTTPSTITQGFFFNTIGSNGYMNNQFDIGTIQSKGLGLGTNSKRWFMISPTGDIETTSEYQKLYIGTAAQSYNGYITGDDISNKKLMLYHPLAVRLSNSPVTNPGTNISDGLYVSNGNSIGMNTFPETRLHVNLRNNAARFDVGAYPNTETADQIFIGYNNKMSITFRPFHGTGNAWMHLHHTLNNELMISNGGSPGDNPMVTFNANGQVFMGRKKPVNNAFGDANARLIVEGKIIANEIVANNNAGEWSSFPDYVFEKDYKLMPLDSLRGYIATNKHLPEIPSAKEVEANGLHLSSLAVQQMKKIEELTLYLLEQQKQMQVQQEQMQTQQKQIADLQKEVSGLRSKE